MTPQQKLDSIVEEIETGDHDCSNGQDSGCSHPIHEE